ncbi:cysteine--tRNA ligase [Suttonella sp. R2A3]|uniref:cysteine--tRNA ligase n=1 Tax=Suttonella sp. R2A3 TaxID=2908648 RepID=UPI001F02BF15|nr:cysteine--tRNA ligase [Suttonella sp. R2A3]UJF24002.1 cysteine--tRNA ligase [Suttonella sp. R2A3]
MSALQFYNSLSRKKEPFQPLVSGKIGLYVCGMTVYDYCHIGHARVMVVFDTIARHLRHSGYELNYVRNITDIDDKIIKRARENNESIATLTERFIDAMHEDEQALGCLLPDHEPRATQYVSEMIEMIATLIDKGHAYVGAQGDVYYAIDSFASYGALANQKISDLRAGERIDVNEDKRDPLDFVLWKSAKPDEPSWTSPWGEGRPGWHIECSVMSAHQLGTQFDIHGGGMDLKFPHHECEIAQSDAACGHKSVNYWIHNGFVQIDNEKMSKSLGNFFTVRDVLAQFDGEVIRYFMLASHYRGPLNYSDAGLREAQKGLSRLYAAIAPYAEQRGSLDADSRYVADFDAAMNDDFNTPKALSVLFDLARALNKATGDEAAILTATLRALSSRLGLLTRDPAEVIKGKQQSDGLDAQTIEARIAERQQAKQAKDFAKADAIRDALAEQGVLIKDTPEGTEWRYQ